MNGVRVDALTFALPFSVIISPRSQSTNANSFDSISTCPYCSHAVSPFVFTGPASFTNASPSATSSASAGRP